jgi:outer membrane protein W
MNKYFLPFILLFASLSVQSQSNEWLVGLSGSSVKLNKSNVLDASLNDLHNFQFPKLNVSRSISSEFSLEAAMTIGTFEAIGIKNEFNYLSLDMNLIYNFNLSENKFVPHFGIGASFIGALKALENSKPMLGINVMTGGTFWLSSNWGLNSQIGYKFAPGNTEVLNNHIQLTGGVVYSLTPKYFRGRG